MVFKPYPPEFRADAVALYLSDSAHTLGGVARDLGISRQLLHQWVHGAAGVDVAAISARVNPTAGTICTDGRNVDDSAANPEPGGKAASPQAQLQMLRRELAQARRENRKLAEERDILRAATQFFRTRDDLVSRCQFIEDHGDAWSIQRLCHVLNVARSSFYKWRAGRAGRARRAAADAALAETITAIHAEWSGTWGSPRITAELREQHGMVINEKKVARVIRRFGIVGLRLRRRAITTIPDPEASTIPDLFGRDFTADAPNTKYMGDITYLPYGDGQFLYLATVIDCHSRRVAGWSIADHMRTDLVTDALQAAAALRGSLHGAIFHSDHGAQYTSAHYADLCRTLGVARSMGSVGTSADNAACESFHASLKRETLQHRRRWDTADQARTEVLDWLESYNTRRRHSANGQLSPTNYEHSYTLGLAA